VSHAAIFVNELESAAEVRRITLEKRLGETFVPLDQQASWTWPSR
jgi:hypothetical protein